MFTFSRLTRLKKWYKIASDNSEGNGENTIDLSTGVFQNHKDIEADQQQRDIFYVKKVIGIDKK